MIYKDIGDDPLKDCI